MPVQDIQNVQENEGYQEAPSGQAQQRKQQNRFLPALSVLFFPAVILYHELLMRAFDQDTPFFTPALARILLFSAAAGLLLFLILDLLPWRRAARITGGVLIGLGTVIFCTEYCCKSFFKTYFGLGYMGGMAGQVVGDFAGTMFEVVFARIPFILLALVPLVVYVIFCRRLIAQDRHKNSLRLVLLGATVLCQLAAFLLSYFGSAANYYTYDFTANSAIPQFGLVSSLRLEVEYALFGTPQAPLETFLPEPTEPPSSDLVPEEPGSASSQVKPEQPEEPGGISSEVKPEQPEEPPVVYGYNTTDIDFAALAEGTSDKTLKAMHQYFGSLTPSQQNEYTGYFEGKNLILLTAEAFSPYVISEELTPTLYRLTHEGFVFNNYYQPNWSQSTTGGEFAVMTGLIPTWIDSKVSFRVSAKDYMPYALGWQFSKLGYNTLAYHNNSYTYYNRNETHPNLGYDYCAINNGLVLASDSWPNSDLEMMQATVDGYINDYVENGTPFHTYYMTVSGHCNYGWGINAMSRKNREAAEAAYPDASETVQAYIACNLELEYAMAYLVDKLEAAGIADDTVIVLSADHYPYAMAEGDVDYYNELTGLNDSERDTSRYRNSLILWSGCMEEPVVVDTPCSSIDIVPTLSNLFGLEYDSRLYSGRDVFATNYEADQASTCMPLVVFADIGYGSSWITAAGTYEASTKTFTPNEGITVDDNYVSTVSKLVSAKYSYAKLIIQEDYYREVFGE